MDINDASKTFSARFAPFTWKYNLMDFDNDFKTNFLSYLDASNWKSFNLFCHVANLNQYHILYFQSFLSQGVVAFSSQGDRIALTQIEQMVDGQYHKLGYYDTQADNLTWFNNEQWVGGKVDNWD